MLPLFEGAGSANDLTRWAAAVSLVEKSSFEISWTRQLIGEKFSDVTRFKDGSVYSNSPPGIAVMSAPFYALVRVILGNPTPDNVVTSWLVLRFIIASLPLLILAIWLIGMEVDTFSLGVLLFATPLFPYSLVYSSHVLVAVLVYFAFRLIYDTRRVSPERCFHAGLMTGFALLCEFEAIIPLVIFGLGLTFTDSRERLRRLLFYFSGAVPFILVIAIYSQLVFGSPIAMLSNYEANMPGLSRLYALLVSPSSGLFFFAPVLLFSVLAVFDSSDRSFRRHHIKLVTIFLTFLAALTITARNPVPAIGASGLIIIIPLMLDSFFDGETEDFPSVGRGALFVISLLLCTVPVFTYSFAPSELSFPHNSFWQPLLYQAKEFTPTLAGAFGAQTGIWTILPPMILLVFAIFFVWRDAKYPVRFAAGILAGILLVGNYMFLISLEKQKAEPFLRKVEQLKLGNK